MRSLEPALLRDTSLLFVNEHEMTAITAESDLDRGLRSLLDLVPEVVVTRGAEGSDYAARDGARRHRDAPRVEVVDTTAAGDVYAGVFVATRAGGGTVEQAMARATSAAALTVQRRGTSGSIPLAAEVGGSG